MKTISKEMAKVLIESSNGRIFSAVVLKRTTGEKRTFRGRYGPTVSKGVKGIGLAFSPEEKNLIPVYLMAGDENQSKESTENRRFIAVEGIQQLTIDGETFAVV